MRVTCSRAGEEHRELESKMRSQIGHRPVEALDPRMAAANRSLQNWQQFGRAPLRRTKNPYRHKSAKNATSKRPVTIGGSAGHSQLFQLDVDEGVRPNRKWDVTVKTGREAAAENTDAVYQSDAEKVREALAAGPLCKTPLRDAAGIRSSRIDGVLERMIEKSVIDKVESGSRIKYDLKR